MEKSEQFDMLILSLCFKILEQEKMDRAIVVTMMCRDLQIVNLNRSLLFFSDYFVVCMVIPNSLAYPCSAVK